jgi:4-amino-4-deoxy-L-arabinose transferase-like glycosyltransferase
MKHCSAGVFRTPLMRLGASALLFLVAFVVLAAAITTQSTKKLNDFDQSFYTTIAYDLDRYGVFSSGVFDDTDSTQNRPPPGMFFVPGYPLVVLAAMKLDHRFEAAVRCSVESSHHRKDASECEDYALPMHLIHALLLAAGVLAIARSAEAIFANPQVFWIAGGLATASLSAHANLFSFVMTESLTIALFCVVALFALLGWQTGRMRYFALAGIFLGLLCLTRPSFVILIPVFALVSLLGGLRPTAATAGQSFKSALVLLAGCALVVAPWIVRNHLSAGKPRLTQEYGSAALIERFAYNDMTAREFAYTFAYCLPGIGDVLFDKEYGDDSMRRFTYFTPDSFFHAGRGRRDTLVEQHGRLDPIIAQVVIDELRANWWRHLLVSVSLGWCGMWTGRVWSLLLVPLFALACFRALRTSQPLLLMYAAPALVMFGVHALIGNHHTRYNLILIAPYCVGAAWLIHSMAGSARARLRALLPTR